MNSLRRTIMTTGLVVLLIGVCIFWSASRYPAWGSDWMEGDVFVGVSSGSYKVYNNAGNFKENISDGMGGYTTGCSFNPTLDKLYTTNFSSTKVIVYDNAHPHNILQTVNTGATSPGGDSESIVFDASGNFYVGHPDGNRLLHKYDAAGNLLTTFSPATENRGTDWNDLATDQQTMFYTSEGGRIMRFDVVNNVQLADFANIGGISYALRLLPPGDGSGGLLVANTGNIKRLDGFGNVVQTYDASGQDCWFSMNLDPNGTSFWAGDFCSSNFYRFNITTGAVEVGPINTGTGASTLFGICLKGEITAAIPPENCTNGIDDDEDKLVDNDDPDCHICGDGNIDPGEQCDDGNTVNGDGCSANCELENQPPVAQCQDVTVSADASCQGSANVDDGSYDPEGAPITLAQEPLSPYELGITSVNLEVTDDKGASDACSAMVTVNDNTLPAITCPGNQTAECTGPNGASVSFSTTATDNCGVSSTGCSPDSGSTFPLGTTPDTCTATDIASNQSGCSFTVTVVDTKVPVADVASLPDVTGECSAEITSAPTATDICSGSINGTTSNPLSYSEQGTFTVNWTYNDGSGNSSTQPQTVIVDDVTPPTIQCNSPGTIIPPNAPISFTAIATDNCETVSPKITGYDCWMINGAGKKVDKKESCVVTIDGDTITIVDSGGVDDHIEWTVVATDAGGNTADATCEVVVVNPGKGKK